MPAEWTVEEAPEAIAKVIERAAADADFRRKSLSDPAGAVLEASGKALPAGYRVRFVDGAEADATIVLPDPNDELSESALAQAAGGMAHGGRSFSQGRFGPSGGGSSAAPTGYFKNVDGLSAEPTSD